MKPFLTTLLCLLIVVEHGQAAEQRIDLVRGWNAVHLELTPEVTSPVQLFGNLPIEQVALWMPSKAKVESLTDPAALPSKPSNWLVWHPAEHPAAFLNTLMKVQGRRTMLIKAHQAIALLVTGTPLYERQTWIAPSFNLVGFDVNPAAPPTFQRFFAGSRAHESMLIYRLVDDRWKRVAGQDLVERGEAYWVWCQEGSDFQGPLDVTVRIADELNLQAHVHGPLPVQMRAGQETMDLDPGRRQEWSLALPSAGSVYAITGGGMRYEFYISAAN